MNTKALTLLCLCLACRTGRADRVLEADFPTITVGTNNYTNAHLRAYSLTEGSLRHDGGLEKIHLSDLQEPARSKFYDGKRIKELQQKEAARIAALREAAAKADAAEMAAELDAIRELSPKEQKTVKAEIRPGRYVLSIKNLDSRPWPEINIYINGDPLRGYGIALPSLKPGQTTKIQLNQFEKRDGLRFDPSSYSVVKVWIGGRGFDYEAHGF